MSKYIPYPARHTVRVSLNGRRARPTRGARLFLSVSNGAFGALGSCNGTTMRFNLTSYQEIRLYFSVIGVLISYRKPRFTVRRSDAFQSSWKNAAKFELNR